jgi:hypothetical protein
VSIAGLPLDMRTLIHPRATRIIEAFLAYKLNHWKVANITT